ncbi:putative type II/III system pilus formation protein [Palleronia aestuarii]|uniref:Putative type II/III system pilus formation protein n=1 Tax=Palleronia aestuarii TaxID=568105 RepID=A0A2W7MZK9_9RHOB|nr:pilus assembly protein N-terminal domain-containing protein [Palleronia aestuarii]PZX13121.1 putative type II/III system pilus formation protein [Palleronia aestuarii]
MPQNFFFRFPPVRLAPLCAITVVATNVAMAQGDGQDGLRLQQSVDGAGTIVPMGEVGETFEITVGHSRLLTGETPFDTIIVGDDAIVGASPGPGDSIIVTGLAAGSTNLIVLDQGRSSMLSTQISVSPVTGPLRSTVTVLKGAEARESYECRGMTCLRTDDGDEQRELPFVLLSAPDETQAQEN